MLRFRATAERHDAGPFEVEAAVADVLRPAHFFVRPPARLEWQPAREETIRWEVFRGRLLPPSQTRQEKTFHSWNIFLIDEHGRSGEALLSVKWDRGLKLLHVVRAIHCRAWEGYDAGGGVILSRETCQWVNELVGSIDLAAFRSRSDLRDELIALLFEAIVGTSRLPLTSVEGPMPSFSFGTLAYVYRASDSPPELPFRSWLALLDRGLQPELAGIEKARLLETVLRSAEPNELPEIARAFAARWQELGQTPTELVGLLRALFNQVSLSPYTRFVEHSLGFLRGLEERGSLDAEQATDFLAHLLRQTARHLTAYDLVTFHHFGANYPDALMLDSVLKAYLERAERRPDLFLSSSENHEANECRRLRRRALRQGWLFRRRYEGHLVPDIPTSQGENARILPSSHPRVPEEQILNPLRRTRRLFADDPLGRYPGPHGREILEISIQDLSDPAELRELGTALFLDRPLGVFKGPTEPDQTAMLSYVAFSRMLAERQLDYLARTLSCLTRDQVEADRRRLREEMPVGVRLPDSPIPSRPAVVSLEDSRKVAPDIVLLKTTRSSVTELFRHYDFRPLRSRFPLAGIDSERQLLFVPEGKPGELAVYDAQYRRRAVLQADATEGYGHRAGVEYLVRGLRVMRVWEETDNGLVERSLQDDLVILPPNL